MIKKLTCFLLCGAVAIFASYSEACNFNPANACEMFAYQKYFPEVGAEYSYMLATQACSRVSDVEVLQFLWSKHVKSNSSAHAMDLATEFPSGSLNGKLELVQYAWSWYMSVDLSYSVAATKAADGAAQIDDIECLATQMRTNHAGCNKTALCIDQAFAACTKHK